MKISCKQSWLCNSWKTIRGSRARIIYGSAVLFYNKRMTSDMYARRTKTRHNLARDLWKLIYGLFVSLAFGIHYKRCIFPIAARCICREVCSTHGRGAINRCTGSNISNPRGVCVTVRSYFELRPEKLKFNTADEVR